MVAGQALRDDRRGRLRAGRACIERHVDEEAVVCGRD